MPYKALEIERIVGPCSKHVSGEGWVTEVPVTAILGRGYIKEKYTTLEERQVKTAQNVRQCTHSGVIYVNMQKAVLEKNYKYCPHCGAKVMGCLSIKGQILREEERRREFKANEKIKKDEEEEE